MTQKDLADRQKRDAWFRVEVSDHEGQIVAIEPAMLAGRDIGDAERDLIEKAIRHLSGFIGAPHPDRIEQLERELAEAKRDGWVLVPKEPTEAMLRAALDARYQQSERSQRVKERYPEAYETWMRTGLMLDARAIAIEYRAAIDAAMQEPRDG